MRAFLSLLTSFSIFFTLPVAHAGLFKFLKIRGAQSRSPVACKEILAQVVDSEVISFIETHQLKIDDSVKHALVRMTEGQAVTIPLHKIYKGADRENRIAADIKLWQDLLNTTLRRSDVQFAIDLNIPGGYEELTVLASISSLQQRDQMLKILMQDQEVSVQTTNTFF